MFEVNFHLIKVASITFTMFHFLGRNQYNTEMGKAADPADISVLFFPAGANFWHMHTSRAI